MSCPDREHLDKIEHELEKAEHEFRRAAEAKSFSGMMQMHNRVCQLVASLSAAYAGGAPTVFASHFQASTHAGGPGTKEHDAPETSSPYQDTTAEPQEIPAQSEHYREGEPFGEQPEEEQAQPAAAEDELPDIAVLEKQLADLASKMQSCLEAGDMDGMLKASEGMGVLSELMTRSEARKKEKDAQAGLGTATGGPPAQTASAAGLDSGAPGAGTQAGAWMPGDTMALARQRAEERKKQQKLSDSFDAVVGELTEIVEKATEAESASSADSILSERMKQRLKDNKISKSQKTPRKLPKTAEELREKLDTYNFYQLLSVPSTASFEELHKSFFKKIRRLNQRLENGTLEMWQFQEFVASLCLAHDVLRFPNARLQYDLVIFGDSDINAETAAKSKMMPLREMLKFSTLINPSALAEALEMYKGNKNEREVGYYLVEQGHLSGEEFDSILFAQKLVSAGKLTVTQFELAMQEMRDSSIPLLDTLFASEWIRPQDVFSGDFI
jgi:hypothetical protein